MLYYFILIICYIYLFINKPTIHIHPTLMGYNYGYLPNSMSFISSINSKKKLTFTS